VLYVEERLRRVREALHAEKEAHTRMHEAHDRTRQELDELKRVMAGLSRSSATVGPDMGMDPVSPTLPSPQLCPLHLLCHAGRVFLWSRQILIP